MSGRDHNEYIEDNAQIDALDEFAPRIRQILREYRKKRQLAAIAKKLGFHPSRLTEMITKNSNGQFKKRISPYYLAKFIDSEVMSVQQVLQGRNLDELPDRSRIFFERMILPKKTIKLVIEAQRRGIDIDRILRRCSTQTQRYEKFSEI